MLKVVFFGTPQIAVPSLEHLTNQPDIKVVKVVTQPDKPSGRGQKLVSSPIKQLAEQKKINVLQPTRIRLDNAVLDKLRELKPDIFITFAFGQILSQEVLDIPRLGTVNLHASLLPKYRGANPIQWPIINGDKYSGVTTMLTDIGVDTGDILLTEKIEITENMTSLQLMERIAEISPEILHKTIIGLNDGTLKRIPQNEAEATHARKVVKEDGIIDWNKDAVAIHNLIRGVQPWPMATTKFNDINLKIIEASVENSEEVYEETGKVLNLTKNGIIISASKGSIVLKQIQPEGKKVLDAYSYSNGARMKIGDKLN